MAYRHVPWLSRYWENYDCYDSPSREPRRRGPGRQPDRGLQGAGRPAGDRADPLHERQDPEPPGPQVRFILGRVLRRPPPGRLRWYDEGYQRLQVGLGGEIQLLRVRYDRRRDQTPPPRHGARQEAPVGA